MFHYTRTAQTFWSIMNNGLRFSYCKETLPGGCFSDKSVLDVLTNSNSILIPIVCFCDIPIMQAHEHTIKYGEYSFGFDKQILIKALSRTNSITLNPVFYYNDRDMRFLISNTLHQLNENQCDSINNSISRICGLLKPISETRNGKKYEYYEEREWRVINHCQESFWKWKVFSNKEYNNDTIEQTRRLLNEKLHNESCYLPFAIRTNYSNFLASLITHIIVKKETQVNKVIEYLLKPNSKILGHVPQDMNIRKLLCSRVTSMERIKKDY